jgi:hypothetical protein
MQPNSRRIGRNVQDRSAGTIDRIFSEDRMREKLLGITQTWSTIMRPHGSAKARWSLWKPPLRAHGSYRDRLHFRLARPLQTYYTEQ